MKKLHSMDTVNQTQPAATRESTTGLESASLEVNVIFTELKDTAAALKAAESLAKDLGACIRVRAAIAVPVRLGLDQSPVSIPFMEQRLRDLIGDPELNRTEHTLHLYVCRDAVEALLSALQPNSVVLIGGRKHWWPTAASRMAAALRARGHRVVLVDRNQMDSQKQLAEVTQ